MTIGQRIQAARKNKNITQRELAATLGLATGSIQQYELDKRQPRLEQLQSIAKALNVPWVQLAGDEALDVTVGKAAVEKIRVGVETEKAVLSLISRMCGSIEDKEVSTDLGSMHYYLVGTGDKSFVLYDFDVETIEECILNMMPPIVDRLKDTRDERDIVEALKKEIGSDESKAAMRKAIEAHKKRFPQ